MIINELSLANIRNHAKTEISFNSRVNVFYGNNGAGKTTLLEAISICGLTKSFLPVSDAGIIRNGENNYQINLRATNALKVPYNVSIKCFIGAKKQIGNSFADNNSVKEIIGQLPLVILSPDYKSITFGSPENRRSFIDSVLCQTERVFLEELMKYRKALKQRNNLLNRFKLTKTQDINLLEPWTEMLISIGAELIYRRARFVNELIPDFKQYYDELSAGEEEVSLGYIANHLPESESVALYTKDQIAESLAMKHAFVKYDELRRGTTLFGPQKDDMRILINGGTAKDYASQGQHKSLLISLKFAEFVYMKERRNEIPVVLLDDIFSELDKPRSAKVLEMLSRQAAQTFITVTDIAMLKDILPLGEEKAIFEVSGGKIIGD
jgi:DNA replication and repair protein RecF